MCLILKLRRSLLPYYSVNICDPTPMTTVVETSHVVGTEHTDGLRLAYLPKYCDASSETFQADDDDDLRALHRDAAAHRPGLHRRGRRRLDRPARPARRARARPRARPPHGPVWPGVEGLGLASASQVYPRLLNGDSIVRLAEQVAAETSERLALPGTPASATPVAAAA